MVGFGRGCVSPARRMGSSLEKRTGVLIYVVAVANDCFIISPISTSIEVAARYANDSDHCRHVIDHLLAPAVELAGFNPVPPEARGADLIHAGIVRHLESSEMVLCDMSAVNPNVFYELGIRTAVNKPFSLIVDELTPSIPFDAGIVNTLTYDGSLVPWGLRQQIELIAKHIEDSYARNPKKNQMWEYFGLTTQGSLKSVDESSLEEKIDFLISRGVPAQVDGMSNADEALSRFSALWSTRPPD